MRAVMVRLLTVGVVGLGLGWSLLSAEPPPDDPRKVAQAAIVKLSDNLEAKDVGERARLIVKDNDSCDISSVFTSQRHGGLGIGKATEAKHPDSIERLVRDLAHHKTTTEAELEQYRDDYLRVAKVMQAMAELAPYRGTPFTGDKPESVKAWAKVSAEFKEKTAAFRRAVEETDPKQVRVTTQSLEQTCFACHNLRN
jgi:hypothetical protein